MRVPLLLIVLAACSHQAPPLSSALVIPPFRHGCHAPAPDPKPLPALRTLEQYKQWAEATAHARTVDKLSLAECTRKVNELVDTLDIIRATLNPSG